jgi:2-polyprenyl-3-methyl-5-hydroxy-6-metoxy-1,4-benzoquinol methylase
VINSAPERGDVRSCPLCQALPSGESVRVRDENYPNSTSFSFAPCESCGCYWLKDPLPQASIASAYAEDYYSFEASPNRLNRIIHLFRSVQGRLVEARYATRQDLTKRIGRRLHGYPLDTPVGRVLDVGCGAGSRLCNLSRAGWATYGVDIDWRAISAAQRLKHSVVQASGDGLPFADQIFDSVVASHSIEHTYDPRTMTREIFRVLKVGGEAVISTPNSASWTRRLFGASWRGWDPPRHLLIFSKPGLLKLLAETGFEVRRVRGSSIEAYLVDSPVSVNTWRRLERLSRVFAALHMVAYVVARVVAAVSNRLPGPDEFEVVAVKP